VRRLWRHCNVRHAFGSAPASKNPNSQNKCPPNLPLDTSAPTTNPWKPKENPRKENEQPLLSRKLKPPTGTASSICRVETRSLKIVAAGTRMQKTSSKLKSRLRKSVNKMEEKRERARGWEQESAGWSARAQARHAKRGGRVRVSVNLRFRVWGEQTGYVDHILRVQIRVPFWGPQMRSLNCCNRTQEQTWKAAFFLFFFYYCI
jgi:hypothetical protein